MGFYDDPRVPLRYEPDPQLVALEYDLDDARASGDPYRIAKAQGIRDKAVAHASVAYAEPLPRPEPEAG
jgi:hypothetical protein